MSSANVFNKNTPKVKKYFLILLVTLFAAFFVRAFLFEAYKIPTGSMENTLLPGDFIIVNKAAYSISTPHYFPVFNFKIPSIELLNFNEPKRNDVIVFEFPGNITEFEDDNFVKRIIGEPGDIVQIINKRVYVNGKVLPYPKTALLNFSEVKTKGRREKGIFPPGENWNKDNYGPIQVPKKEITILLNPENIKEWKNLINNEFGKKAVSVEGTVININGKPVRNYTFQKDYYFVMGDNRDNSLDSRFWGFVPRSFIIGKADFIYWSWDFSFSSIRFNRIFKSIK